MIQEFDICVRRSHSEPTEDGLGTRLVHDMPTYETITVEVDFEKIANLRGPVACRAKSGVSRAMGGLVVVKKVRAKK